MFVYTFKASGLKFFAVTAVSVALLIVLIGIIPVISAASDTALVTTDFRHIESEGDVAEFLSGVGIEVDSVPERTFNFTIPEKFNSVMEKYNAIQRSQGLNLKRYCGKDATVYIYKVNNYEYDGEVFATLFIRNGQIIAGDISSADGETFVKNLSKN